MAAAAAASGAMLLLLLDGSSGSALGWRLVALLLLVARPPHGVARGAGLADNVVWAVNAGGEAHVDVHGIHFRKDPLRTGGASPGEAQGSNLRSQSPVHQGVNLAPLAKRRRRTWTWKTSSLSGSSDGTQGGRKGRAWEPDWGRVLERSSFQLFCAIVCAPLLSHPFLSKCKEILQPARKALKQLGEPDESLSLKEQLDPTRTALLKIGDPIQEGLKNLSDEGTIKRWKREKTAASVGSSASEILKQEEDREIHKEIGQNSETMDTGCKAEDMTEKKWNPVKMTDGFLAVINRVVTWEMIEDEMRKFCIDTKEKCVQTEEREMTSKIVREREVQTDNWRMMKKDKKVQVGGRWGDVKIGTHWDTAVQVNRDLEKELRRVAVQTEDRVSRVFFKEVGVQTEKHETGREREGEVDIARGRTTVKDVREGVPRRTDVWRKVETGLPLPTPHYAPRFPMSNTSSEGKSRCSSSDPNPIGWIPGWGWSLPQETPQQCCGNQCQGLPATQRKTLHK